MAVDEKDVVAIATFKARERAHSKRYFATQFIAFRKAYLLTQTKFAELLKVSRRSVQYTEAGVALPMNSTCQRFRELKVQFAKKFGGINDR
jgi:DNA-binding transcriptional regulator YiaG